MRRRLGTGAGLVGLLAAAALLATGLAAPAQALQGWLVAYLFWSAIPLGGLVLVLIHALTAGRWLDATVPAFAPALATLPVIALLFLPLALGLHLIYPWATDPAVVTKPEVARFYLNDTSFLARTVIALAGWSLLAVLVPRLRGGRRRLAGGLGLCFHGLVVSLIPIDWILSLDPGFTSSDFAAGIAVTQLAAALAWAALLLPDDAPADEAGDLAGLLLATVLGVLYLAYMQFVVAWYGDLPPQVTWYLRRNHDGWLLLLLASLALGVLLPFAALLFRAVRRRPAALRWVGASVLVGVLLRMAWLVAPEFGPGVLLTGALAATALGGAWVWLAHGPMRRFARQEEETLRGAA